MPSLCRIYRVVFFVIAMTLSLRLEAQPVPTIAQIEVVDENGERLDAGFLRPWLGRPTTRSSVRQILRDVLDSGRFSFATVYRIDQRLRVRVRLRRTLHRVDISGNELFTRTEIVRELELSPNREIQNSPDALSEQLRTLYASQGYRAADIRVEERMTSDPSRRVLFIAISEHSPTRVASIRVDASEPDRNVLLSHLSINIGDEAAPESLDTQLRSDEQELRQKGYFEAQLGRVEVSHPNRESAFVTIRPHIGPRYALELVGFDLLSRAATASALDIAREAVSASSVVHLAHRLEIFAKQAGFLDARVEATIALQNGQRVLRFRAILGPPTIVTRQEFPGGEFFSQRFLRGQLVSYLREVSFIATSFVPRDPMAIDSAFSARTARRHSLPTQLVPSEELWDEEAFARACEHIRALYEVSGFRNAEVGPARLVRDSANGERIRAHAVIPIREGQRTLVEDARIRGVPPSSAHELLAISDVAYHTPFSPSVLAQACAKIASHLQQDGFYFANVSSSTQLSGDGSRVQVTFEVTIGPSVQVDSIRILGLSRVSESLVLRTLPLQSGDVLTPDRLREAQERLYSLGLFQSVHVGVVDEDLPAAVKTIEVVVSEADPQFLDVRLGVSTGQGVRSGIEYGYRNVGGAGITLSLAARLGYQFFFLDDVVERRYAALSLQDRLERQLSLSLSLPLRWRTVLALSTQRENERNFGLDRQAIELTFTTKPSRLTSFTWTTALEVTDVTILGAESYDELLRQVSSDVRLRGLLRVPEGASTLLATRFELSWDGRDSPFTPTRGLFLSGSAGWARTLSTSAISRTGEGDSAFFSHHLRLQATVSGYVPFDTAADFVVAGQLKLGRIVHLEPQSDTYPNRQFFLGGVDTVRGYLQDALVPQDVADELVRSAAVDPRGLIQGGDAFLVLRGELRFPIIGVLRGGLFLDLGNSWRDADWGAIKPWQLRPTAGLGLRVATPVGPIALDYGILLDRRRYLGEPFGSFHFSMGLF